MKKPNESDYGFNNETGWPTWESEYEFLKAYRDWDKERKTPKEPGGRPRIRPIHESWNKVLQLFDSTSPQRSQGSFCKSAGLDTASFSNAKCRPITTRMELKLSEWIEELEKAEKHEG